MDRIYNNLTPEEIVSLSYWTAVNDWGILAADYPQSYLPGECGCITTSVGNPPEGIPEITVSGSI